MSTDKEIQMTIKKVSEDLPLLHQQVFKTIEVSKWPEYYLGFVVALTHLKS